METHVPADFNLQNWATVAVAAAVWNKSRVTFINDNRFYSVIDDYIRVMVKKTGKAFHSLPRNIGNQILSTVKFMAQRIYVWCEYAELVKTIPENVAVTVYWTVYGTIDEGKILQNCLDSKMIRHEDSKQMQAVYYAACSNVCIDYIRLHWEEMLEFCKKYTLQNPNSKGIVNKWVICSVIFLAKLESSQLPDPQIRYFNDFNYNQRRNMFMLSVEEGCPQAARYYWSLLSAAEKKGLVISAAILSLDYYWDRKNFDYFVHGISFFAVYPQHVNILFVEYNSNCSADLLIFFITQMSEDEISELFDDLNQRLETDKEESIKAVFDVLIYHWPLEEFLPLAYNVALKSCEKPTDYKKLVERLLQAMHRNKKFGLCNKQNFHQKLFKALWNKLRKYNTCEEILSSDSLLESIYELFDLEVLKFIIDNCEDKYRKTIMTKGKTAFDKLVRDKEFELLQKFMDDVLRFEDEREWFQNQIKSARSGLKLIFNNEKEKRDYIKNSLAEEFSWVTEDWKIAHGVDYIQAFFRWLLKSEVESSRIQKELICSSGMDLENSLFNIFNLLLSSSVKHFEIHKIVDEFLLVYLSPEKVTAVKRNIRKELKEWIKIFIEIFQLDCIDEFLNWIIESEDFKKKFDLFLV